MGGVSLSGACGSSASGESTPLRHGGPTEVRADLVPAQLAGLHVNEEDVQTLEKQAGRLSYLSDTRLWALRDGDRLRATLQVGTFVPDSEPSNEKFQDTVASLISGASSHVRNVGGHRVSVTSVNKQPMYIWVQDEVLFVLTLAGDHQAPRTLLRSALDLRP
jgi:hypothetical protein